MRLLKFSLDKCLLAILLAGVVGVTGCSQSKEESGYESMDAAVANEVAHEDTAQTALPQNDKLTVEQLTSDSEPTLGSKASDIVIAGKELMISASASFKTEDVVKTANTIETLTQQQGGYIASSSIASNEVSSRTFRQGDKDITITTYYRQADMIVRLPKNKVSSFMRQVQQQVKFLYYQEFKAQDVTLDLYREQLEAQLNADMAGELNEQRLNSDNEKEQRSNIDAISATYTARQRQQYAKLERMNIADKVNYSTIELNFTQPNSVYKEVTQNLTRLVAADKPSFAEQAQEALIDGWQMIKQFVLGLIKLWWLWALFIAIYLLYKALKNIFGDAIKRKLNPEIDKNNRNAPKNK